MGIVRRYRLLGLAALVVVVLASFLSFFFVFLVAPLVPLGLLYLGYLFTRERAARREQRQRGLLEHEAEERKRLLERELELPPLGLQRERST